MTYVIGDLNGYYEDWKNMIIAINLRNSDTVFLTGNIIGSKDSIKLLNDLMARPNVFSVLGEREYKFSEFAQRISPDAQLQDLMSDLDEYAIELMTDFIKDGGRDMLMEYLKLPQEERESILEYFEELTLFDEFEVNGKHFYLSHSGINGFKKDRDIESYDLFDYISARPGLSDRFFDDSQFIFGHTPTFEYGDKYTGAIIKNDSFINVNCGSASRDNGGCLGCIRLDDMKEYYL